MFRGSDWARSAGLIKPRQHWDATEWYIECQMHGLETIGQATEIDPERRGGLPVLRGTGFTVAQLLAELSETSGVEELAEDFNLDPDLIRGLLNGLSLMFQRPHKK